MPLRLSACALVLVLGMAAPAAAQQVTQAGGDAFTYQFMRPGRATMTIYIWGNVSRPGIWRVEREVDLIELLSAARVPALREDPEYRERMWLTVYRGERSERRQVYRERLDNLLEEGATYPDLQQDDILELDVERNRRFNFRAFTQYLSTAMTLVLLLFRLGVLDRNRNNN